MFIVCSRCIFYQFGFRLCDLWHHVKTLFRCIHTYSIFVDRCGSTYSTQWDDRSCNLHVHTYSTYLQLILINKSILYYFFDWKNFFRPLMFYIYNVSTWKIFSNTKFLIPFSNWENFPCWKIFLEPCFLYPQFYQLRKFSLTPIFYCRFFDLKNFLRFHILNTIFPIEKCCLIPDSWLLFQLGKFFSVQLFILTTFPTWKIFSDTIFLRAIFWIRKFSPTVDFLHYFFDLKNFFDSWFFILTTFPIWKMFSDTRT